MTTITAVIPTYNRAADLERCLRALKAQTLADTLFEVIVVDDGSSDSTPDLLARWTTAWNRLRYFRQANAGPATARNAGITNAIGSVVAFTDDDCVPPPDWLERIHERFSAGLRGCLNGADSCLLPSSTFVHSVIADGAVITSNIAVERAGVRRDRHFRRPVPCSLVREDADLYYRMRKASIPITYDPDLIVDHPPRYQAFWSSLRKSRFYQYYGLISMARKHPDMEPLTSCIGPAWLLGIKKLALRWGLLAVDHRAGFFPVSLLPGLLASPAVFCILDGFRLRRIKANLTRSGIQVRPKDQVLYILLNWTSNLAESYYLFKGALLYR